MRRGGHPGRDPDPARVASRDAISIQSVVINYRSCVLQRLLQIVGLEKWIFGEQALAIGISRKQLQNSSHRDPHSANAGLAAALPRFDRYPIKYPCHVLSLDDCGRLRAGLPHCGESTNREFSRNECTARRAPGPARNQARIYYLFTSRKQPNPPTTTYCEHGTFQPFNAAAIRGAGASQTFLDSGARRHRLLRLLRPRARRSR